MVRVLPEPGPACTSSSPPPAAATDSCSALSEGGRAAPFVSAPCPFCVLAAAAVGPCPLWAPAFCEPAAPAAAGAGALQDGPGSCQPASRAASGTNNG
eukprot:CAMPEP_0179914884 /NCGR_PEP_ID=MMETSP0983-20121128/1350_1 /TAXON_ID=483367 /ORGANISM="non described non described, Strain CCMP 2436" /LENGTH=97 /DNA_ID=CAMNT_0021817207 /DNA_START=707 /DNA_END=997 /DNA_ORIENTATION=+